MGNILAILIATILRREPKMKFITVSELRQLATKVVSEIETTGEEVIVTKNGRPVVLMRFITDEAFTLKENEKDKEKEKYGKDEGNL